MSEEIALGVFNTVIWSLYNQGEHRGGEIVEKLRDKEGLTMINKKEKAYQDRKMIYDRVDMLLTNSETILNLRLVEIKKMPLFQKNLAKVYYCITSTDPNILKSQLKTPKDIYNFIAWSYMQKFEGWNQIDELRLDDIFDVRAKLSTVERCIRFVKADKSELFNEECLSKSLTAEEEAKETFGNSATGL